ncbi:MAG: hypothetical protein PVJ15_02515, partial [Gammaproteobacteria bacterium]
LLSGEVLEGITGFLTREVGTFILPGKTRSLTLHELLGHRQSTVLPTPEHILFAAGLAAFRRADWTAAIEIFTRLANPPASDRLSSWYLERCRDFQRHPPAGDWDGAIQTEAK